MDDADDTTFDGEWPYLGPEGLVDEDSTLEAVAFQSGVRVSPAGRVRVHQKSFSISRSMVHLLTTEATEAAWEEMKAATLEKLLTENGLKLTFDSYDEPGLDATFGRWTLEKIVDG